MKFKLILLLTLLMVSIHPTTNTNNLRTDVGIYYDYLVIETSDGNEWLLAETDEPVTYTEGSKYLVVFDTMGTDNVTDDEILDMLYMD